MAHQALLTPSTTALRVTTHTAPKPTAYRNRRCAHFGGRNWVVGGALGRVGQPGLAAFRVVQGASHRSQLRRKGNRKILAAGGARIDQRGSMAKVSAVAQAAATNAVLQFQSPVLTRLESSFGKASFMGVQTDDIAVGGHRGMGENILFQGRVQPSVRENTVASFTKAHKAGARFIEFDVQVTKDGVPVVWHDATVAYGNADCPTVCAVRDLTLAEFKALGLFSASGTCTQLSVVRNFRNYDNANEGVTGAAVALHRAVGRTQRAWKCQEEDVFPTLEDLFNTMPPDVGFNIEVKMATPETEVKTSPEEVSRTVRPILRVIQERLAAQNTPRHRTIVFSSFDPEVCISLRAAQDTHPVMFLSTGGSWQHVDPRRMSIEAALAVAKEYNLSGVVLDTGVLMREPHMVQQARMLSLKVLTYGVENSDAEWLRMQRMLGVHAVIVDDVEKVMSSLRTKEMVLV